MKSIRHYKGAGVAVYGGITIMVVLAAVGLGVWFLVYEDEIVKVEVTIADIDLNQDPAPAEVGVRITSKIDKDVEVKSFRMRIWTDETKEDFILEEKGGGLSVPGNEQVTWYFVVEIYNVDEIQDSIYIEFDLTHQVEGEDNEVTNHFSGTRDLSDIWEQL